jgi:LacI family transcriptional regulator
VKIRWQWRLEHNTILDMATLADVARKANVSPSAASRILNHDSTFVVSRQVRLNVTRAAVEMGYRTPRQKKEGAVIEVGIADWHSVPDSRKDEFDYSSLVPLSDTSASFSFSRLEKGKTRNLDAVIGVGIFDDEEIDELLISSPNIVFLNSNDDASPFDRMFIDYDTPVEKAIDWLIEKGKRKIAFLSGVSIEKGIVIGKKRIRAIREIMQKKGILDESLVRVGELTDESGREMAEDVMKENPDAIVLGTQLIEKGVLEVVEKLENPPFLILRRDIDLDYREARYPVVRMSSVQLWQITLMLIYMRSRESGPPLKVFIEASFETGEK